MSNMYSGFNFITSRYMVRFDFIVISIKFDHNVNVNVHVELPFEFDSIRWLTGL